MPGLGLDGPVDLSSHSQLHGQRQQLAVVRREGASREGRARALEVDGVVPLLR